MAIVANFNYGQTKTYTAAAHQYDINQKLTINGIGLSEAYEVHISNAKEDGFAAVLVGNWDGVMIPDRYFESGEYIYLWIYPVNGEYSPAYDVYEVVIPIIKRSVITNVVDTNTIPQG